MDPDWYASEAPALMAEARELFESLGDHAGLAATWDLESGRLNQIGHPPEMFEAQQQSLEHSRLAGDLRAELEKLQWLAVTTYWGTTPVEEGIRRLEATLEEVRGHADAEARLNLFLAGFLGMQGRFDEARALLDWGTAVYEELGLRMWRLTSAWRSMSGFSS